MTTPPFETSSAFRDAPNIRHGFFGRKGGVSTGIYDSLNVGIGSGDDPAAVAQNRERIRDALDAEALLSCYQIHSVDVITVEAPWTERPEADAMVTATPGLALCILTADCTPILFADTEAGVIGAAHAGWKGAIGGVTDATLTAMESLGAQRSRIKACIGPTIGPLSYEVGPEFRETFMSDALSNAAFFTEGAGDRYYFNLPAYVARRLSAQGLTNITNVSRDTCALEDLYFSNRRRNHKGEPDYGRNASVIMLTD